MTPEDKQKVAERLGTALGCLLVYTLTLGVTLLALAIAFQIVS